MKYLLLKHYRGAPVPAGFVPMDQWTPEEVDAHLQYMDDFAGRLEAAGEFVDGQALAPDGAWVRYDGEGRPPVTDGPFAETKDLIAGWMVIDVDSYERAVELAGELSAHVRYMQDWAARLERTGEFIEGQALTPDGIFVRSDGEGRPPVTDGPFAETKDLIAGGMVIDVETYERAVELAGELSAAPGAGGKPIHEWLELRPFMVEPPTITE